MADHFSELQHICSLVVKAFCLCSLGTLRKRKSNIILHCHVPDALAIYTILEGGGRSFGYPIKKVPSYHYTCGQYLHSILMTFFSNVPILEKVNEDTWLILRVVLEFIYDISLL